VQVLQPFSPASVDAQVQPLGCVTADELLELQRAFPQHYPVLLQSAATSQGHQHDLLMAFPQNQLTLYRSDKLVVPAIINDYRGSSFLDALDLWWQRESTVVQSQDWPFSGGWFLYLGYELAAQIEPSISPAMQSIPSNENKIVAQAVRFPSAIVRDAFSGDAHFVAENSAANEYSLLKSNLEAIRTRPELKAIRQVVMDLREEAPQQFLDAVDKALKYIAAGDVYQTNLSRGWSATVCELVTAQDIYQRLCAANPAPFAGVAILNGDDVIISSSPERLISIRNGQVSTRPIAGTRSRSTDQRRDAQMIDELRSNPKEQAEHVMLLDLERNDIGRVCRSGTVHVDEYMTVESYAHVHHIVSNVRGELRDDVTPGQAIAAVFPGGTITGCPKVRCMQIIAELEHVCRGAYTGSMGYLNRDGSMDLNILIRSLHLHGKQVSFRAGAGIVADSVAQRELDETRAKALGLIRALGAPC